MVIALPSFFTSTKFHGKATAFFVEFFQGHFILLRRPCLGTPNFISCQLIYQGGRWHWIDKMIYFWINESIVNISNNRVVFIELLRKIPWSKIKQTAN